jgi:peptidyl-prolyl cis-trans isomerase SurA
MKFWKSGYVISIAFMLLVFCNSVFAQQTIDKIVAVVNNQIVTQSELDFQTDYVAAQKKLDPTDPELKKQILDQLVNEKLVYAEANLDSITVTDDEVDQRVEDQINAFEQQYGSIENLEKVYNMSMQKIKSKLRDDVREQLMIQKLQQKNFGDVEVSGKEVEDFFNKFKDSLGVIPEKVQIAHIFMSPKASPALKAKYKEKAEAILDSLKHGADFAEMAKKYSDDPGSASKGGDLGFVKRGVFYPSFEAAAFALKPGQLSDVVETPVGFHIIQMIEKRGESIHVRHILIKVKKDQDADLKTIEFLSNIRDSIVHGDSSFAYYAKKYSEDEETKPFGGDLGTFYMSQLDNSMKDIVSNLKQGEISFPKRIDYGQDNYGYHIVYLEKRIPQHPVSLKTDYSDLEKLADNYKKQQLYNDWIKQLRKKIYFDERL